MLAPEGRCHTGVVSVPRSNAVTQPDRPKIFHITSVDNLPSILQSGGLLSDAAMLSSGGPHTAIGMSSIKQRRLSLPVPCHRATYVGDYVPFYFCPRSVMLHVIHCKNHPGLAYRGGQEPILHLQADLHEVVAWADESALQWAFSLSNAGARYASFHRSLDELRQINWRAVRSTDFRDPAIKEGKQAEFLVHGFFPWKLIEHVGACTEEARARAHDALTTCAHQPVIDVRPGWYY